MKFDSNKLAITDLTYEEAKKLFARGVKLYVGDTGPFGENEGATVLSFDIKDADVPEDYDEEAYGSPEDLEQPIVVSKEIGQSGLNWGEYDTSDVYAKIETRDVNESMSIEEALLILEDNKIKTAKDYEAIARRRWRAKVRRSQRKTPELMAKLEKMYDRILDFDRDIEAPWISRALANEDYKAVKEEKERINKLYKRDVVEPFDDIADDLYRAIDHNKESPLFKLLSKFCRKLESMQFFHSEFCHETDAMRRINDV